MIFTPVDGIDGAWLIDPEPHHDGRGAFTRTYVATEWRERGMTSQVDHIATSSNRLSRTLRGMHLQAAPYQEAKTVRCTRGRVFDVIVDVRPGSSSFGRWAGFELDEPTGRSLHLPAGTAHGFLTLVPDTELTYLISAGHRPEAATGFRWDDPEIAIKWPCVPETMSDRDAMLPSLADWTQHRSPHER